MCEVAQQIAEEIYKEENPESKMGCPSYVYELVAHRLKRFLDANKSKLKQFCKTGKGCVECDFTGYKSVYGNIIRCDCCNNQNNTGIKPRRRRRLE